MKHYAYLFMLLIIVFLISFVMVMWLDLGLLTNPEPIQGNEQVWAASFGVFLLIADVVIPVPASLIMIAHGAIFGLIPGTLLSLLGGLGGSICGFTLGRCSKPIISRWFPQEARDWADQLLAHHGVWAVIITRPIPLLAETVIVVAGSTSMRWVPLMAATVLGVIPAAFIYALAGSTASKTSNSSVILFIVMVLAFLSWFTHKYFGWKNERKK